MMTARLRASLVSGLVLAWVAATPVGAGTVIFSNLGPGESYQANGSWPLGTVDGGLDYVATGSAFTSPGNYQLGTIGVAAGFIGGANSLTISLDADSGGSPGAVIESFTVTGAMPPLGSVSSGNLVVATSVLHPLLTAGTQYWVVLSVPNDGTSLAGWNMNSTGDTGPLVEYFNGSPTPPGTYTRGAMIITSAVPEPSSIALAATSVIFLVGCAVRRRCKANAA